jgi:branched-chain amino acid transport system substrate-binding protein
VWHCVSGRTWGKWTDLRKYRSGVRRVSAALLIAAFASAACAPTLSPAAGGASATAAPSGDPYVVGFTSDFSSNFGYLGLGLKAGNQAYFDSVNAAGGINGHPVKMIALDDNSQPDRGVANVTQLITQNNVTAITGVMYSVICSSSIPLVTQYKVPMFCGVVSHDLVDPVQPYVYAATLEQAAYAAPQVQMAKQVMDQRKPGASGIKAAVVYSVGSAAIEQWYTAVASDINSLGWNLVDTERVPTTAVDMSAELSKVIAAEPDVMILGAGNDAWVLAGMKQIAGSSSPFPVISYDVPSWATVKSLNTTLFYYVAALAYAPPTPPESAPLMKKFEQDATADNLDPNGPYVLRGYIQALIIGDGLKRCGFPCSGDQLRAQLDNTNINAGGLVDGSLQLTATNHEPVTTMAAYQWDSAHTAPVVVGSGLKAGTAVTP